MKLKNLILLSALVTLFTMFLGTQSTYAQGNTWYVDNLVGSDGYDGLSPVYAPTPTQPNHGPRKTISGGTLPGNVGAYQSAVPGDVIYVAYTGSPYIVGDGEQATISITKKVTFRTYNTGSSTVPAVISSNTVQINPNFEVNNANAAGSTNLNQVIFDGGNFLINGGNFYLTNGVLVGGNYITVASGTLVTRTAGSIASGQLKYADNLIDFTYNGGATTVGLEFPAAGGTFRSLNTDFGDPVTSITDPGVPGYSTINAASIAGLANGMTVVISGVTTNTQYNGTFVITNVGGGSFRIPVTYVATGAGLLTNAKWGNPVLTIDRNITMTGVLTTGANLVLGTNTLTLANSVTRNHTIGGTVNGTLDFNLGAGASIGGAFNVNNVTVRGGNSTPTFYSLDLNVATLTGNLYCKEYTNLTNTGNTITNINGTVKAENFANITLGTTTATIGTTSTAVGTSEIWNSGYGVVSVSPATVYGNVLLNPSITSATANSGIGRIVFGAAVTVNGDVLNQTYFKFTNDASFANADAANAFTTFNGVVSFPDASVTITGDVVMGGSTSNWTSVTLDGARTIRWNGLIVFNTTTNPLIINKALKNSVVCNLASTSKSHVVDNNGIIVFPYITSAAIRIDGGIQNSSQFTDVYNAGAGTNTDNGTIDFDYYDNLGAALPTTHVPNGRHKTSGKVGDDVASKPIGPIINSSKGAVAGDGNGDIYFGGITTVGANVAITGYAVTGRVTTVTTTTAGLANGQLVVISGGTGNAAGFNGTWQIQNVTGTTFDIVDATGTALAGAPVFSLISPNGPSGDFFGTSITINGSAVGGYTMLPNVNVSLSGNVVNNRTSADNNLQFGVYPTAGKVIAISGMLQNNGTGTTSFPVLLNGTMTVTGKLESTLTGTGTISVPYLTSGASSFGSLSLAAGTIRINGNGGGSTINVNSNFNMTGGTLNLNGAAAAGDVTINGSAISANFLGGNVNLLNRANVFVNAATIGIGNGSISKPIFTTTGNATTTFTVGTPSPVAVVNITIGSLQPYFPGIFKINSAAGIDRSVVITGINGGLFKTNQFNLAVGFTQLNGAVINLGMDNATLGAFPFINDAGYESVNQGRVVLSGTATQTVATTKTTPLVGGVFGDFEATNSAASPSIIMGDNAARLLGDFKGTLYLTQGTIANGAVTGWNIRFNNNTVYPTIVVNQGAFTQEPTFVSNVNVVYVGLDKVTGFELPSDVTKLNDLIVATTNGAGGLGKGSVLIQRSTTVNGTLTVNAGQTLVIANDQVLSLNGAVAGIQGNVANLKTGAAPNYGALQFVRTGGTIVTAAGYLPQIWVANNSTNNQINGALALIHGLLGDDAVVGGAGNNADVDVTNIATSASEDITYLGANGSLSVGFGTPVFTNGSHVDGITTNGANNTLTLTSNLVDAGVVGLNHVAGTIQLGNFTLTEFDASPSITAGALITSNASGLLRFAGAGKVLSCVTNDVTIDANVDVNLATASTILQIDPAAAGNLIVSKNFTVTSGLLQLGDGTSATSTPRNLTLTGQLLSVADGSGFDTEANSFGYLILNPTVAPLTWTENNSTTQPVYPKVSIVNDVNLDPAGAATTLNIAKYLDLKSGVFNYNGKDVAMANGSTIGRNGGAGTGTFNTATATGWLILNGTTVTTGSGSPWLAVNNLRFTANGSTITGTTSNNAFSVNKVMDLQNTAAGTVNTINGKLTVASNVTVNWSSGAFDAAPNYVKPIVLNLVNYIAGGTNLSATVWPTAMPDLVGTLTVNGAAAPDQVNLPAGTLQVNTANSLYLTRGILNVPAGTTLTLAPGINVYRTNLAQLLVAGSLVTDPNYNLFLYANTNTLQTGRELPAVVNNLTLARTTNVINYPITLDKTVTVNGTLDIKNDVTQIAPAYLQANGTINIVRDNTYNLSTVPTVLIASFIVGGQNGQTMTLGGNVQFPNLTVDMQTTVTNPVLNVNGSFTMLGALTNRLAFNNGIINMVDGILYLPNPVGASNSGLGYVVTGTGHVVGNVARPGVANQGQVTDGRFVFPTGTAPDVANARKAYYRPITITFNGTYPLGSPTTFIVNHKTVSPEGIKGFENGLDGGGGVTIGKYPNFYWGITASPTGLSQTQMYDVEMQGSNLGYPYTSYTGLRGIRRLGNSLNNPWLLLTTDGDNNSQQIFGTDTTVWVRSTATQGGIVSTESRFTIGIPVIAPGFSVPATSPVTVTPSPKEGDAITLPYTVASNILGGPAPTVTYSLLPTPPAGVGGSIVAPGLPTPTITGGQVSGNFTWTPGYLAAGTYTVTILAHDAGGDATAVYNLTVTDNNRIPQVTNVTPLQPKVGVPVTITFNGTDADGDPITWNRAFVGTAPSSGSVTPPVGNVVGNQYVITFTPKFEDLHQTYTFQASYTDGKMGAPLTVNVPLQPVVMPNNYGDVNRNGSWDPADPIEALRMSVGLTTSYTVPVFTYDQYNYALADVDGVHNIGNVVTYGAATYGISAWDAYLILMKVSNNATTFPVGVAKPAPASGELALGKAVAKENGVVAVPLTVQNARDIYTVTFELNFDTKVAEVVGLANTPKDWLTAYSVENGVVKVVMAGASSINASNLGELNLRMKNKEDKVQISGTATINNLESKTLATMTVGQVPAKFALDQNYPNPFNPSTTIKYQIAEPTKVTIAIYSIDGQLVNTLVSDTKDAGYYSVVWNGTNSFGKQVASGMYIYRIDAGNFVSTKKLMLMK